MSAPLLRRLRTAIFRGDGLATLGDVSAPRAVEITGAVVGPRALTSPVSGARCAYYHAEIGETIELAFPALRESGERHTFRALAEMRSPSDLEIATADRQRVLLSGGFFLVKASLAAARARPLARIPDELGATLGAVPRDGRALGYREITLRAGDRVRFSGVVEPVIREAPGGYRGAPARALRMRPEREPIVVVALA